MRFREWLIQLEMVGTGAVYDGTKSPDFNWWGDPGSANRPPKYASEKDFKYNTTQSIVSNRSKKSKKS